MDDKFDVQTCAETNAEDSRQQARPTPEIETKKKPRDLPDDDETQFVPGGYYSRPQTAKFLGLKVATLDYWAHKKKGPKFSKAGRARYQYEDIIEFLKKTQKW